jgi:C4-type Zn-finger protein
MLPSLFRALGAWMRGRVRPGGTEQTRSGQESYRKCPKCEEGDFRVSDRQRLRPEVYGSRTLRVKWLCLSCGHRETEIVEGPD